MRYESQVKITIVTLTRDNHEELVTTVQSVLLQNRKPDRFLVVDGSTGPDREKNFSLASIQDLDYQWVAPKGIYAAMRFSLGLLEDDHYVLWLNSSDWLTGPNSLAEIESAILRCLEPPKWVVGRLIRRQSRKIGTHAEVRDAEQFLESLQLGKIGFPHPSTFFRAENIKEIDAYNLRYRVASDYDTAIQFGKEFGEPAMVPWAVATHVPDGFSARHPLRGWLEKLWSRFNHANWKRKLQIVFLAPYQLFQAIVRHLGGKVGVGEMDKKLVARITPGHFCGSTSSDNWPSCCDKFLSVNP